MGNNTTGINNTAVGVSALLNNITGYYNTAVGVNAGRQTIFADSAGAQNNTWCTFLGENAGTDIAGPGGYNYSTALGVNAMITANNQIVLGTASESVSIPGYLSVKNATSITTNFGSSPTTSLSVIDLGSSKSINIIPNTGNGSYNPMSVTGYSMLYTTSSNLLLSTQSSTASGLVIGPNSILIGAGGSSTIPSSNISINGSTNQIALTSTFPPTSTGYSQPSSTDSSTKIATTAWVQSAISGITGIGGVALLPGGTTVSTRQIFTGYDTFSNDLLVNGLTVGRGNGNISSNTVVGFGALAANIAPTGAQNSAFGQSALANNTIGTNNCAFGENALIGNTVGTDNIAIGVYALQHNTDGSANIAIGTQALHGNTGHTGYNVAIGSQALYSTQTSYQVAVGHQSLYSNISGVCNSAFGIVALYYNTSGSSNTSVGYASLNYNTTGSNNTGCGFGTLLFNTTGQYNTAVGVNAGNQSSSAGAQNNTWCTFLGVNAGTDIAGLTGYNYSTALGVNAMITANHQIVLGTASEHVTILGSCTALSYNATSDYRIKTNITELDETYKVDNLRPVQYTNTLSGKQDIGFIAHEMQEYFPYLVNGEKDGPENQSINYSALIPLLVKEIQDLKERVKILENKL